MEYSWKRYNRLSFAERFRNSYRDCNISMLSKGMVYATLVAMVPCLAMALSFFKVLGVQDNLFELISSFLVSTFGLEMGQNLVQYLETFTLNAVGLGVTGIISYVITFMILIDNIWNSVNRIYEGKPSKIQGRYLLYFLFLVICSILISVLVLIKSRFGSFFNSLFNLPQVTGVKKILSVVFPYFVFHVLIWCTFRFLHSSGSCFISAFIGASVCTVLVWLLTKVFGFTVGYFVRFSVIYGSLASILLFLMYLLWGWRIILTCAVLAHDIDLSILPDEKIFGKR